MQYELENVSIRMVKEPPLLCDKPVNSPGRAVEVLYLNDLLQLVVMAEMAKKNSSVHLNNYSIM